LYAILVCLLAYYYIALPIIPVLFLDKLRHQLEVNEVNARTSRKLRGNVSSFILFLVSLSFPSSFVRSFPLILPRYALLPICVFHSLPPYFDLHRRTLSFSNFNLVLTFPTASLTDEKSISHKITLKHKTPPRRYSSLPNDEKDDGAEMGTTMMLNWVSIFLFFVLLDNIFVGSAV